MRNEKNYALCLIRFWHLSHNYCFINCNILHCRALTDGLRDNNLYGDRRTLNSFLAVSTEMGGKVSKRKMREMLASASRSQKKEHDEKIEELNKQHDKNLEASKQEFEEQLKKLTQ